ILATHSGVVDSNATLLVQTTRRVKLKPGKTIRLALPIRSLLASLSASGYTLIAQAIDPASNHIASTTGPAVQVAAPFIALSETFGRLTLTGTAAAGAKTRAVAAVKIVNGGNLVTPKTTSVSFYLSSNGVIDSNAMLIRGTSRPLRIRPGKSTIVQLPLRQLPAVAPGAYSIVAQVVDPDENTSSIISA